MDATTTTPQGSKSNDGTKKKIKTHHIPCKMYREKLTHREGPGLVGVIKPGDLPNAPARFKELSKMNEKGLVLTYLQIRGHERHYFDVLQKTHHKNILHMETAQVIQEGNNMYIATFIEPYTGTLRKYMEDLQVQNLNENYLTVLRHIGRCLIEALDHLRIQNCYHGNLSLDTTVYQNSETIHTLYKKLKSPIVYANTHEIMVKLANFASFESAGDLEVAQLDDWFQLGSMFAQMAAHLTPPTTSPPPPICAKLNELANFLQSASTKEDLKTIKEAAYKLDFFWDKKRRTQYFMCEIPLKLRDPKFKRLVWNANTNSEICTIPWDTQHEYQGLLKNVQTYRFDKELQSYNGNDVTDFLRFISAAYTHRNMIEKSLKTNVDGIIQEKHPRLCSILRKLK